MRNWQLKTALAYAGGLTIFQASSVTHLGKRLEERGTLTRRVSDGKTKGRLVYHRDYGVSSSMLFSVHFRTLVCDSIRSRKSLVETNAPRGAFVSMCLTIDNRISVVLLILGRSRSTSSRKKDNSLLSCWPDILVIGDITKHRRGRGSAFILRTELDIK